MKTKMVIQGMVTLITCITIFSCKQDKGELSVDCSGILPDTVSFSKNIVPLFNSHCNISGCHSGSNPTGHLNLESSVAYTQLMKNGSGYIDTLNPTGSVLYSQLISSSRPMPPSGNLDYCTTQLVLKWIQQKARNN